MPPASEMRAFVSFSPGDLDLMRAAQLVAALARDGIDVWAGTDRDAKPGRNWGVGLDAAVKRSNLFVVLLTPRYMTTSSCMYELGAVLSKERDGGAKVVPIVMKDLGRDEIPAYLKRFNIIDGRNAQPAELAEMIRNAVADAGVSAPA